DLHVRPAPVRRHGRGDRPGAGLRLPRVLHVEGRRGRPGDQGRVIRAADRGLLVCVVYDGFANLVVPSEFQRLPRDVHVLRFPVLRTWVPIIDIRSTGRDHRKILVVDGRVGFVGGYNIGSLYADSWRDTHVRVV